MSSKLYFCVMSYTISVPSMPRRKLAVTDMYFSMPAVSTITTLTVMGFPSISSRFSTV